MPNERKYNWVASVMVLMLGWLLLYATRTGLSSALKDIGNYWGLGESYLGFLSASFAVSYAALQIPSGLLSDRFGPRRMIVVGFVVQAAGLILGVLSKSPSQFLLARILTGAGQATYFACQQVIVSHILPPERRSAGTAVTVAGAGFGSALGFMLGKMLSGYSLGWKMPFLVLGGLSVAFVFAVMAGVPEVKVGKKPSAGTSAEGITGGGMKPADMSRPIASAENMLGTDANEGPADLSRATASTGGSAGYSASSDVISLPAASVGPTTGASAAGKKPPIITRHLLLMSAVHFLTMYGFYLMLSWLPYYLETVRKLEGSLPALIPIAMPLIMAPAAIAWGAAADRLKDKSLVLKITLPVAALATAAVPVVKSLSILTLAIALYGASGKLVADTVLVTAVAQAAPPEQRGATLAIFNFAGALAMVISPWATGIIAERLGGFDISFYIAGLFNLLALVAYVRAVRMGSSTVRPAGTGAAVHAAD